jgi:hypothetical protein
VEVRSHRLMEAHLDFYREHAPGFEHAQLLYCAPPRALDEVEVQDKLAIQGAVLRRSSVVRTAMSQ